MVSQARAGHVTPGKEQAEFLFPRALWVFGPLHVVWSAFEEAILATKDWAGFREFLSAALAFLGDKSWRQRLLHLCMRAAPAHEQRLFQGWKQRVVDWKRGYMEEVFVKMAASIGVFLGRLDVGRRQRPAPAPEEGGATLNPKCLQILSAAQEDVDFLEAKLEALAVFSRAVGHAARWFTGCRCHDHIWQANISDEKKAAQFRKATGNRLAECLRRGRTGHGCQVGSASRMP